MQQRVLDKVMEVMTGLASLLGFALLVLTLCQPGWLLPHRNVLWVTWTLAPPIWFLIQYILAPEAWKIGDDFQRFQYSQQIASKVWLAMVSITTALYFGGDFTNLLTKLSR